MPFRDPPSLSHICSTLQKAHDQLFSPCRWQLSTIPLAPSSLCLLFWLLCLALPLPLSPHPDDSNVSSVTFSLSLWLWTDWIGYSLELDCDSNGQFVIRHTSNGLQCEPFDLVLVQIKNAFRPFSLYVFSLIGVCTWVCSKFVRNHCEWVECCALNALLLIIIKYTIYVYNLLRGSQSALQTVTSHNTPVLWATVGNIEPILQMGTES